MWAEVSFILPQSKRLIDRRTERQMSKVRPCVCIRCRTVKTCIIQGYVYHKNERIDVSQKYHSIAKLLVLFTLRVREQSKQRVAIGVTSCTSL